MAIKCRLSMALLHRPPHYPSHSSMNYEPLNRFLQELHPTDI